MQMSPRKKFIITSIMLITLISALVFAFVIISNNIRTYRNMLESSSAKISSGEKEFSHMVKISDVIKNRSQDIQRIQHIAIDPERPLRFIETIEQIGRITGVKVALTINEKQNDMQELLFRATLQGDEKNVRAMLALIEQLPYQINITHISFQRDIPINFNPQQTVLPTMTRLLLTMRVATQ